LWRDQGACRCDPSHVCVQKFTVAVGHDLTIFAVRFALLHRFSESLKDFTQFGVGNFTRIKLGRRLNAWFWRGLFGISAYRPIYQLQARNCFVAKITVDTFENLRLQMLEFKRRAAIGPEAKNARIPFVAGKSELFGYATLSEVVAHNGFPFGDKPAIGKPVFAQHFPCELGYQRRDRKRTTGTAVVFVSLVVVGRHELAPDYAMGPLY
jgi:hypothetical protein